MDRENSNVFTQLSESLGATKILTQELLQFALDGTPKDMLQKMYKQHCGNINLLPSGVGRNVTTTERDSS